MGSPVKQARPLTAKEIEYFQYAGLNYVKLKDEYLAETSPLASGPQE